MHTFEKHPFTSSLSQEVVTYDQDLFTDNFLFNSFFENENIEDNIDKTNKVDPYSLLIDTFKEMTNHMEDHCCLEDIMEVSDYLPRQLSNQRTGLLQYEKFQIRLIPNMYQ